MAEAELPLQFEVDRLFGLPPEDFVKEREALARRLRSERRRDEAQEVHSLKKPSQACGAINRVARDDPRLAHDVVSAGDALREAQVGLGSGGGSDVLRAAAHAQRQAVARFTRAARVALAQGGPGSEDMLRRIRDTLLAAATDPGLAEQLRAGRVVSGQAPVGFGPLAAALGSVEEPTVPVLELGRRELEAASLEAGDLEEAVKLARDGAARASGRLRELEGKAGG